MKNTVKVLFIAVLSGLAMVSYANKQYLKKMSRFLKYQIAILSKLSVMSTMTLRAWI